MENKPLRVSTPFPATHKVEDEHHERDHEKEMNQTACDVKRKSTAPKQQEKNGNN